MIHKKKRFLTLLLIITSMALAGGLLFSRKVTVLCLENTDHHRALHINISPSNLFSIFHINSLYDEPVVEQFEAIEEIIVLKGVRTKSHAVSLYYGFEDIKDCERVTRKMESIFLRVGMEHFQELIYKGRKLSFSNIGNEGERIELSVKNMPMGYYTVAALLD